MSHLKRISLLFSPLAIVWVLLRCSLIPQGITDLIPKGIGDLVSCPTGAAVNLFRTGPASYNFNLEAGENVVMCAPAGTATRVTAAAACTGTAKFAAGGFH